MRVACRDTPLIRLCVPKPMLRMGLRQRVPDLGIFPVSTDASTLVSLQTGGHIMTTGCRTNFNSVSLMCLTRSWGVFAAGVLVAGAVGCVPAQTTAGGSGGAVSSAPAAVRIGDASDSDSVRIEAIQRYDGQASETVTGVVTVRNTSSAPRTVNVGVTWIGTDGSTIGADQAARETVTLGPRESRELVFRGEQGSRDFKVALTSVVQ